MFCRSDLCRYNFYLTDIFARVHSLSCTYKYRDRSFNWDQDLKKIRIFGLCGILFFTVLRTKKKKIAGTADLNNMKPRGRTAINFAFTVLLARLTQTDIGFLTPTPPSLFATVLAIFKLFTSSRKHGVFRVSGTNEPRQLADTPCRIAP